jgi:hypothetical protein
MAKKKKIEKLKTYCSCCLQRQHKVKKTVTCPKGHDKVEGMTKAERNKILARKKEFSVQNAINIQIGDDEGEHGSLFYRILGSQGNLLLRVYRVDEYVDDYGETRKTSKVLKSHGPSLNWIMKRILEEELTNQDAATLEQLLEVLQGILARLDSLEESIYWLSEEGDE